MHILNYLQLKNNNKTISFWGAEAPPYGGMTIHIQRLTQYLQIKGWDIIQYNFNKEKRNKKYIVNVSNLLFWYLGLWFKQSPKIHYVISTRAKIRFLASLLTFRGKKVIIRVGGESFKNEINVGGLSRLMNIWSLKYCSSFIGVNDEICQFVEKYSRQNKINHIPGFIPPQLINQNIPNIITDFFKTNILKIVVTGQIFGIKEKDIYGLFHFIDSLHILKKENFKFKSIIVLYGSSMPNFNVNLQRLESYISKLMLNNEVLIYVNNDELWPIINLSDVFIRPSITDGDANSIREALFLGKSVIASDCVNRPNQCVLYNSLNSIDLAFKIYNLKLNPLIFNIEEGNERKIENLLDKLINYES
jgi:hypothetical protein